MSVECSACDIPPGYKQTEVGVIPEDWDLDNIENLAHITTGSRNTQDRVDDGQYPFFVRSQTVEHINSYSFDGEAILTAGDGVGTGKVFHYINGKFDAHQRVYRISDFNERLRGYFFYLYFSNHFYNRIMQMTAKSSVDSVRREMIARMFIPLPPKSEQEAIAEALSDADALIESLEQLIAKKRQIKQGAMQELLTGKRRLPGFSGEWETKLLGEVIASCSGGATPYRGRSDYYKGKVKWITSGELNYNLITDTLEHISDEAVEHTNLKIHPVGTFLMAITGLEAAGTRGACGIVGSPATTNQSCMAVYPTSELKTEYLYHYYVFRGNELALQYCQGTKQQSYTAKLVKLLPIDLPPSIEEQAAIASILSDMDSDITTLEKKLAKARQIKQGMMQELLTGRIRLI